MNRHSKKWLEELSRRAQVHVIKKTVETYPLEWIVIHEALQNALDAVKRAEKEKREIKVTLNPNNNSVVVFDNGIGFPYDLSLIGFGGSNKGEDDLGEIGVGIKVVIASTKLFYIESVFKDKDGKNKKWKCKIENGYKLLTGEANDVDVIYEEPIDVDEDTYTQISYIFPEKENKVKEFIERIWNEYIEGAKISGKFSDAVEEKFKVALEHYFRTQGYAANVENLINNRTETKISIRVEPPIKEINRVIEVDFFNKYWDIEEAIERTRRGFSRPRIVNVPFPEDGGEIGNYTTNHIYIQKFSSWESIKKLLTNTRIRKPPQLDKWKDFVKKYIKGIYLVIGSRPLLQEYLLSYPRLQFVAAKGVPSVHELQAPRGVGALGYLDNIFFIVDLDQRLTYGKQTIKNPRLLGRINEFFREVFRATLVRTVPCIVGIRERREEGLAPLVTPETNIVSREDLPHVLSIRKVPNEEVEVIAMFYELIGRGILTGFETWALSMQAPYDGKFRILVREDIPEPKSDRDLNNVEFKVKLSSLIQDLDDGLKILDEINLIIIWRNDFTEEYRRGHSYYEVIPIEGTEIENLSLNYISECLHDRRTGRKVPILELQKVIEKISRNTNLK